MKKHAAPIIAAVLLLLPVLYVGSYFALVTPDGSGGGEVVRGVWFYRYKTHEWAEKVFWPLEQLDRKVRPNSWAVDPFG